MSHAHDHEEPTVFGLLAGFDSADKLADAITKAKAEGYTVMDGYTPYPCAQVSDALDFPKSEMGPVMFIGGIVGGTCGFLMQAWISAVDYPLNIGGRPFVTWPSFIPVTFELTILTTALSGLFGLIALCGLPMYYHPLFNAKTFAKASYDRFMLCIEAEDPNYDRAATEAFLRTLNPETVEEVPL